MKYYKYEADFAWIEWCLFILGILTILMLLFLPVIHTEYRRQFSHRWMTEDLVGTILKRMMPNHTFVKVRPDFLKYPPTGRNLELDFYCEDLNTCVEYNGRQHYEYTPYFHGSNMDKFNSQKQRDAHKRAVCKSHGLTYIEIPYTVSKDRLYNYIYEKICTSGNDALIRAAT